VFNPAIDGNLIRHTHPLKDLFGLAPLRVRENLVFFRGRNGKRACNILELVAVDETRVGDKRSVNSSLGRFEETDRVFGSEAVSNCTQILASTVSADIPLLWPWGGYSLGDHVFTLT
jgi:hypothetical protein